MCSGTGEGCVAIACLKKLSWLTKKHGGVHHKHFTTSGLMPIRTRQYRVPDCGEAFFLSPCDDMLCNLNLFQNTKILGCASQHCHQVVLLFLFASILYSKLIISQEYQFFPTLKYIHCLNFSTMLLKSKRLQRNNVNLHQN